MNSCIYISLLLGVMACASSMHAQDTLVVSERVGKVLDSTERAYFRLFPGIESTAEIVIRRAEVAGIRVDADGEPAMDMGLEELGLLQEYIDGYDSLMEAAKVSYIARNFNHRFGVLSRVGVIAEFEPWEGADIKATAGTGKVVSVRGELLWADEHRIIIQPDAAAANTPAVHIAAADITSISMFGHDAGAGAELGAAIGAGLGLVFGVFVAANLEERGRDFSKQFTYAALFTTVGAAVFLPFGILYGLAGIFEDETDIRSMSDYLSLLPSLQQRMYYRHGLPPDSRWRVK